MTFSQFPRLLKGALVTYDPPSPTPRVIILQYNPNTLTRSLEAQHVENEGKSGAPPRLRGAPVETIKLDVEIDAADQLERGDAKASEMGILPQLAALELLIYPRSDTVLTNSTLLKLGTIEILPAVSPLTLFLWGKQRILPVRVTEFSVTEEAHHPNLNPLRAKVALGLRVLTYSDVSASNPIWELFFNHQVMKETLASLATTNSVNAALGSDARLI